MSDRFNITENILNNIFGHVSENFTGSKSGVISVRLSQEEIALIDNLVLLEMAKSRSEAAATLIREGIKANQEAFENVKKYSKELDKLKQQAKDMMKNSNPFHSNEANKGPEHESKE